MFSPEVVKSRLKLGTGVSHGGIFLALLNFEQLRNFFICPKARGAGYLAISSRLEQDDDL